MHDLKLQLEPGALPRARQVLAEYLPGLDIGLDALDAPWALLPASTAAALEIEYGEAGRRAILHRAGVVTAVLVSDAESLAMREARTRAGPAAAPAAPAAAPPPPPGQRDWHLERTGVARAWALMNGPDQIAWGTVRVGHIDTGYTLHPAFGFPGAPWILQALAGTFFAPPADPSQNDPGPGQGLDPLSFQMDGHGTRTASTICGHAPTAPQGGFYGVAPKVPLVPVRIANHVAINHAQLEFAQAVRHLVEQCNVGVINVSLGVLTRLVGLPLPIQKELRRAIDLAYEAGVILVCAAGQIVHDVVAPACLPRTIAVAGVVPRGPADWTFWSKSAHGPAVDMSGPADGVRRASMLPGNQPEWTGTGDGTSYATAITTGAAALWLAHRGAEIAAAYAQPWQRVAAFRELVRSTKQRPGVWQPGEFGTGVLDVHALVTAPLPIGLVKEPAAA
ncbi:MAG: S8/S53 family peptidase [Rubrivivax sp.]|nr:S8/S53 family peptidase [Rubrivivax sp.]